MTYRFQRRHYELIAQTIRAAKLEVLEGKIPATSSAALDRLEVAFGHAFAADNPQFDMGRFRVAARVQVEKYDGF